MNRNRWVQHISGQGEKWEIDSSHVSNASWKVHNKTGGYFYLPRIEYSLCAPPEVWDEVTFECEVRRGDCDRIYHGDVSIHQDSKTYRLRKVEALLHDCNSTNVHKQYAIIVERRKS